jgi:hypothetical protein
MSLVASIFFCATLTVNETQLFENMLRNNGACTLLSGKMAGC